MSLTSTISILEVAWTAVCLPGLYYAFRLFVRALGDLGILRRSRINSIREYAAITTIILFGSHALVQFVFVLIGAIAMTLPSQGGSASAGQRAVAAAFILVSLVMNTTLFVVEKRRSWLVAKLAEMEEE